MTVQRQVGKDEPVMIAWTAYQQTENFANTKRWATHVDHVQGSLWAAFSTGFYAGQKAVEPSTPPPDLAAMRRVVEAAQVFRATFLSWERGDTRDDAQIALFDAIDDLPGGEP